MSGNANVSHQKRQTLNYVNDYCQSVSVWKVLKESHMEAIQLILSLYGKCAADGVCSTDSICAAVP